jgi:hypothetical protein
MGAVAPGHARSNGRLGQRDKIVHRRGVTGNGAESLID